MNIRNYVARLHCLRGKHRRDAKKAYLRKYDSTYVSVCQHCGVGLVRHGEGDWRGRTRSPARTEI